jgi:hypothetical protein
MQQKVTKVYSHFNSSRYTHTPGKQQHIYTSWVMGIQPKGHIQEKSTFTPIPMNYAKYEHTHAVGDCANRSHKEIGIK